MNKVILEKGDTRPEDIQMDVKAVVIVHGKVIYRKFKTLYCEHCGERILPTYFHCKKYGYGLISNANHNKKRYCGRQCGNLGRRKPKTINHTVRKKVSKKLQVRLSDKQSVVHNYLYGA